MPFATPDDPTRQGRPLGPIAGRHRGFLRARGIDRIGIDFQRDGRPLAWERPVAMRIDCLMALTAPAPFDVAGTAYRR